VFTAEEEARFDFSYREKGRASTAGTNDIKAAPDDLVDAAASSDLAPQLSSRRTGSFPQCLREVISTIPPLCPITCARDTCLPDL